MRHYSTGHSVDSLVRMFVVAAAFQDTGTITGASRKLGMNKGVIYRSIKHLRNLVAGTWAEVEEEKFFGGLHAVADEMAHAGKNINGRLIRDALFRAFGERGRELLTVSDVDDLVMYVPMGRREENERAVKDRESGTAYMPELRRVVREGEPDPRPLAALERPDDLARLARLVTSFRDRAFIAWEVMFRAAIDTDVKPPRIKDKQMFGLWTRTFTPQAVASLHEMASAMIDPDAVSGPELMHILGKVQAIVMDRVDTKNAAAILGEMAAAINELGARRGSQIIDIKHRASEVARRSAHATDQGVQTAAAERRPEDRDPGAAHRGGPAVSGGEGSGPADVGDG